MKKFFRIFPIVALFITSILYGINFISELPENILFASRVLAIIGVVVHAIRKKNLTTWIISSIIIGVFLGYDYPDIAISLKPLSQGFIKLVKTIVGPIDRKSTRLNSSHVKISYAVFCLKKKITIL